MIQSETEIGQSLAAKTNEVRLFKIRTKKGLDAKAFVELRPHDAPQCWRERWLFRCGSTWPRQGRQLRPVCSVAKRRLVADGPDCDGHSFPHGNRVSGNCHDRNASV